MIAISQRVYSTSSTLNSGELDDASIQVLLHILY
jgi:hypothetical protein